MRGDLYSPAYILFNCISLLILLLSVWRPAIARTLLSLVFLGASFFNFYTVLTYPQAYLDYAHLAAAPVYEQFIRHVFSQDVTGYVLVISALHLAIAIGLATKGLFLKLALLAAIIFLIIAAPLGAAAAFPSTVVLAAACEVLFIKI